MKRIALSVEGQTEERFVKKILQPYFEPKEIYLEPKILVTKRVIDGPNYKGGIIRLEKAKREIEILLKSTHFSLVTSLYDLYGLHETFLPTDPDFESITDPYKKINAIEEKLRKDINNHRFLPYIQPHEFECFLFIDGDITSNNFLNCNKEGVKQVINETLAKFNNNPELINNSSLTAPSKRIINIYPQFEKTTDGLIICEKIGLQNIMDSCCHFKNWIKRLENA